MENLSNEYLEFAGVTRWELGSMDSRPCSPKQKDRVRVIKEKYPSYLRELEIINSCKDVADSKASQLTDRVRRVNECENEIQSIQEEADSWLTFFKGLFNGGKHRDLLVKQFQAKEVEFNELNNGVEPLRKQWKSILERNDRFVSGAKLRLFHLKGDLAKLSPFYGLSCADR